MVNRLDRIYLDLFTEAIVMVGNARNYPTLVKDSQVPLMLLFWGRDYEMMDQYGGLATDAGSVV